MMDLRYHLASLISVFLALAVGILVGASLGSSERQAATIQRLQRDVAAIRAEDTEVKEVSAELRHQLEVREAAEQQDLLPLAVRGRLAGNRTALILTGGDAAEELRAPLIRALRLAGAELLTLRLPRAEGPESEGRGDGGTGGRGDGGMAKLTSKPGVPDHPISPSPHLPVSPSPVPQSSFLDLARALLAGRPALLDAALARMPGATVDGDLTGPIHRLLLVCPNDQPEYARHVAAGGGIEAALTRAAQAEGALVVAVEPEANPDPGRGAGPGSPDAGHSLAAASLLPSLAVLGAATVDDANTTMGQIAVVLALAGARGHFGTGPGSSRLLPSFETEVPPPSHPSSLIPHP